MLYIIFNPGNLFFQSFYFLIRFFRIKTENPFHPDFKKLHYIFISNFPEKMTDKRFQTHTDMRNSLLTRFTLFILLVLINLLLNKYFLQRRNMPFFLQFIQMNFKLQLQQFHRIICRLP